MKNNKKHQETKPEDKAKETQQPDAEVQEQKLEKQEEQAPEESGDKEEQTPEDNAGKQDDMEKRYAELNDSHLRLMADFDNYRKRTMREKADLIKNAGERIITEFLPIIDNFERALKTMETADDVAAVREGVELIYNQVMTMMKKNGVEVIETEAKPFDTELHEAITTIPAPTPEMKDKIIDCTTKGYKMNDKVIRHAKVVVGA